MKHYQSIAITGASSGLGRAIAHAYAKPGVTLHLSGRDSARLAQVAATCRDLGSAATEAANDVTDRAGMAAWVGHLGQLDLVIANAGISSGPGKANRETARQIDDIFATNVAGVFNTVLPALDVLHRQPVGPNGDRGRIAVVGSIAGLIALPTSPAYSATKAALDFWVRASAPNLLKEGIALSLIRPGFVRTPMTAGNPYSMPGLMDADAAARRILAGLAAGRRTITFPEWFGLAARLGEMLPKSLFGRIPRKPPGQ